MAPSKSSAHKAKKIAARKKALRIGMAFGAAGLICGVAFLMRGAPRLEAEIVLTPPDYLKQKAVVLVSTKGAEPVFERSAQVPEGSTLSFRMSKDAVKDEPHLYLDGADIALSQEGGDYVGQMKIPAETTRRAGLLRLRDGARDIGQWQIGVRKEAGPKIAFSEPPVLSGSQALRLSFEAESGLPIAEIRAELSPTSPDSSEAKTSVQIASPRASKIHQTIFADMTSFPLAGKPVSLRLVAIDAAGHEGGSEMTTLTLPDKRFQSGLARALLEERKKLQSSPNTQIREEVANIMASVAHQQGSYNYDPVVLLSLRSGAVRLVLDPSDETRQIVADSLWNIASRIEDGLTGAALRKIRQINRNLSDALERENNPAEVDTLLAVSHSALSLYLDEMVSRSIPEPPELSVRGPVFEAQKTILGQDELHARLEAMRALATRGDRDAVRKELADWQEVIENLRVATRSFSQEQKQALQSLVALRSLAQDQYKLRQQDVQLAKSKNADLRKESKAQRELIRRLRAVVASMPKDSAEVEKEIQAGEIAMARAAELLEQGSTEAALQQQAVAAIGLRKAVQGMIERLKTIVVAQPEKRPQ